MRKETDRCIEGGRNIEGLEDRIYSYRGEDRQRGRRASVPICARDIAPTF